MDLSILDLYSVLCSDISAFDPVVGRALPETPFGKFSEARPTDSQSVAALALARSFGKKNTDIVADNASDVCLLKFLESNALCENWRLPNLTSPQISDRGKVITNPAYEGLRAASNRTFLELWKECLRDTFLAPTPLSLIREIPDFDGSDPWSWDNIFLAGDIGPGAALGASGTSWYEKFYQSTLTYTSPVLLEAYRSSIMYGSLRHAAEEQRADAYGYSVVEGGKYGSVPKNCNTDRSIETQPSLNMYAQKGIAHIMTAFLTQKYGFDLAIQPFINQELARRGSITGEVATIDLKEASNRIPLELVNYGLSGLSVLDRMLSSRTEKILLPWGDWIKLSMFSSMGNGFTFTLMTAVFLAALEATFILHSKPFGKLPPRYIDPRGRLTKYDPKYLLDSVEFYGFESFTNDRALQRWCSDLNEVDLPLWSVFGDDLICPTNMYAGLVGNLGALNAEVNLEKSFSRGPFRESCGADWHAGQPVRGVYLKSVKTPQDRIIALNRLVEWTAVTGVPLPNTCKLLWKSLRNHLYTVPLHEQPDAGLRVTGRYAPTLPLAKSKVELEKFYQTSVRAYLAYIPVTRKKLFQGAETSIYGVGILLSMIKGEIHSSKSSAQRLATANAANRDPKYVLNRRADGETEYELQWCYTTCWDSTSSPSQSAAKMDAALSINLGSLLR